MYAIKASGDIRAAGPTTDSTAVNSCSTVRSSTVTSSDSSASADQNLTQPGDRHVDAAIGHRRCLSHRLSGVGVHGVEGMLAKA